MIIPVFKPRTLICCVMMSAVVSATVSHHECICTHTQLPIMHCACEASQGPLL